jgi:ABC-type polysaccharide/polyol phosphate transport system ATPase subunit
MPAEAQTELPTEAAFPEPPGEDAPLAIRVQDLHKSFRIPTQRVDSLKERVVHPFAQRDFRELHALDGVSFEIRQGEFFGIVGRNGSGKSTLLKLLASIYRADSGRIWMAGRLAPFIELGVGFNNELTARENVVLNGVMMGLTPQETRERLDAIIEFAELDEFVDLKLKNYSSGMLVRLAFSLMLEVDADILLIDEVLAVGDASFQQKCADAFREMKAQGKTIILVTHDMGTVEAYCDRAILISEGQIQHVGDPAEVGREYLRLNFDEEVDEPGAHAVGNQGDEIRLLDVWIEDEGGERITNVEHGERIRLRASFEVGQDAPGGLGIGFVFVNPDGIGIFEFGTLATDSYGSPQLSAGRRVEIAAEVENLLAPGRYSVDCGVSRADNAGVALFEQKALDFLVFGGNPHTRGVVTLPSTIEATVEEPK